MAEDQRWIQDAIKGDRLEALYSVALTMGLRQGEALGLRWQDIDLQRPLRVAKQLQRINGEFQVVEPKTKRSLRILALPAVASWSRVNQMIGRGPHSSSTSQPIHQLPPANRTSLSRRQWNIPRRRFALSLWLGSFS